MMLLFLRASPMPEHPSSSAGCHPGIVAVLLGPTASSGRLLSADGSAWEAALEAVSLQRVVPDASLAALIVSMVVLILAVRSVCLCTCLVCSVLGWTEG